MNNYTLYELNAYIRRVLALNFTDEIWVRFEISQIQSSKGHYYLEGVEKNAGDNSIIAKTQGVIWRSTYTKILQTHGNIVEDILQNGIKINAKVKIDYHEVYGLKIQILDIDPSFTMGEIELRRQQIIDDLTEQGLLHLNKMIDAPPVYKRLAIISSPTAAGLEDFQVQLRDNPYGFTFQHTLFQCSMQGPRVEPEMLEQLKVIYSGSYDCILIIRGGGSKMDLSAFDSYLLGEKLSEAPFPVFTGIGHERDTSVLDMVAHSSFKTPTALAHYLIEHNAQFEGKILDIGRNIKDLARITLDAEKYQLQELNIKVGHACHSMLQTTNNQLTNFIQKLENLSTIQLLKEQQHITQLEQQIDNLDPSKVLGRGYSLSYINGKKIRSKKDVSSGDQMLTYLQDGKIISKIE